jgi:hypothetical protein
MTSKTVLLAALLAAPLVAGAEDAAGSVGGPPGPDLRATATATPAPATVAAPAASAPEPARKKHGLFPLWGDAVRSKGFDLPNPYTVMVNYYYQQSEIVVDNLQLGFNGGPMRDFSGLVQVPEAKARASALAVRPAIMVFPFLSFYGVFSSGSTHTDVRVTSPVLPIDFDTVAESGAQVLTLGATFQMGYRGFFGVADFNAAVSDVERLADLVGANMLSFRLGYAYALNERGRKVALWAGTAGQVIDVETSGQVRLSSVLPPAAVDCATVPRPLEGRCQDLQAAIRDPNATVEYSLDKKPLHVWNMVLGGQFALDRNWAFRTEVTFLNGRTSVLAGTEYAFDIY